MSKKAIRILIVEDSKLWAETMIRILEKEGYEVIYDIVSAEKNFLDDLNHHSYDLILADFNLPQWSGREAYLAFCRTGKDIPFILVTGFPIEEKVINLLKMGIQDCVQKDQLSRLSITVDRVLKEKQLKDKERKGRERLERSEFRFRGILEQSELAIFGYDQDGTILFWNKQCQELFETNSERMLGKKIYQVLCFREKREEMHRIIEQIFKGENVPAEEWINVTPEGRKFYIHTTHYGVKDEAGRVLLGVSASSDITEHHKLQEQLIQSQKMEALGRLAEGIAHDFNNHMTVVLGNFRLALKHLSKNGPVYPLLMDAELAINQCVYVVSRLLTLGRKGSVLEKKTLDIHSLLDEFVTMIRHLLPSTTDIQLMKKADKVNLEGDSTQIQQVLMNLAVNARDAMPEGGKLIIETQNVYFNESYARKIPEANPGQFICVSITDTGEGIPPEVLPRIFEPFFTTKKEGEGTGLGLSTVYGIVKAHGGWMHVYSKVGLGSTFKIYFPVSMGLARTPSKEEISDVPGGSETILVADDEEALRELTKAVLERQGYRVLFAKDGEELVSLYKKEAANIHLIIMDLTMPKLPAHETLKRIKGLRPDAKVVVSSGYSLSGNIADDLRRSGAVEFIQKPYHPEKLIQVVRSVLDQSASSDFREQHAA